MTQTTSRSFGSILVSLLLGALALSPFLAKAQTEAPDIDFGDASNSLGDAAAPAGTANCFDYYTFGSVQANLTTSVQITVSGAPITFTGMIANANPYPIVDGVLYVKIFRSRGSEKDPNGPDVVDQRVVKSDIVIPAGGSVPVSFAWNVPAYAKSGEYSVATFFTTSRKFNLLGLSFTDDVVGNTVRFSVLGESKGIVQFDKSSVKVAGEPYYFAAYPPRTSATDPITVEAGITNTTNADEKVTVQWKIYQWDAQLRENVVQEEERSVSVPKGATVPVSVVVKDTKYPVYLAQGTLIWKDTQSVIGVRFVRDGVDRLRINFPSITSYPLKAGEKNILFSCLHNSGSSDVVPGGRLELSLSDIRGNVIHSYTYTGSVTGAMMGVADAFTPTKNSDSFVLDARLYDAHGFVDEAHLTYDCHDIAPSLCSASEASAGNGALSEALGRIPYGKGAVLFVGTVLLLLVLLWVKRVI